MHHNGSYVLPMPEGYDLKKILTRMIRRSGVRVSNRVMATRLLTAADGRIAGVLGLNVRDGSFQVIRAKTVILCCGASGRLGLPASGYLFGTYENPANAGDGYALAYHAGAELTGIECFQINPLIKDYNGPACAYVTGPLGGHTVNAHGHRFIESDYWSGQMMMEFYRELHSANGPVYLKLTHLAPETITEIERVLHRTERPSRGRFHAGRGHTYGGDLVEMHISEIGLCSGHSASGVWVNERGETTVPGLYAAGDMACVPHNYLLGAMTYGEICAESALGYLRDAEAPRAADDELAADQTAAERARLRAPTGAAGRRPAAPVRVQGPAPGERLPAAAQDREPHDPRPGACSMRAQDELDEVSAATPHELMRVVEASFIRDCAEMAARASLYRTESRWGLYHYRLDYPEIDDANWFVHVNLLQGRQRARWRRASGPSRRTSCRWTTTSGAATTGSASPPSRARRRWRRRRRPPARRSTHESFAGESPGSRGCQGGGREGGAQRADDGAVRRARRRRRAALHHRLPHLHRLVPGRLPVGQPGQRQGAHAVRRVLVLPGVRDRLPEGRHHGQDPLPGAVRP